MREPKPEFWEDATQANERLAGTVILYDKYPFYVTNVERNGQVYGHLYAKTANAVSFPLVDPNFHRFRKLPPLGWVNSVNNRRGVFLERIPTRSRSHGFNDQNVRLSMLNSASGEQYNADDRISRFAPDKGYIEACEGIRPELKEVLLRIRPDATISISDKYAVLRDTGGMRWLYRGLQKIGLFVGADTLMLLENKTFYREELQNDPLITIANVREF